MGSFRLKIRMPRRKKEDELPLDQRGPPRGAANLRERTRMRILSKAFGKLKLMLPWVPPDTKLSKLDTLRLATSYISHLQKILDENGTNSGDFNENAENAPKTFVNTSLGCWPYGHHRVVSSRSSSIKSQDDYSVEEERPIYAEESYYPNNEMSFEEQKML